MQLCETFKLLIKFHDKKTHWPRIHVGGKTVDYYLAVRRQFITPHLPFVKTSAAPSNSMSRINPLRLQFVHMLAFWRHEKWYARKKAKTLAWTLRWPRWRPGPWASLRGTPGCWRTRGRGWGRRGWAAGPSPAWSLFKGGKFGLALTCWVLSGQIWLAKHSFSNNLTIEDKDPYLGNVDINVFLSLVLSGHV